MTNIAPKPVQSQHVNHDNNKNTFDMELAKIDREIGFNAHTVPNDNEFLECEVTNIATIMRT